MDEPTNDLDVTALAVLEDYLDSLLEQKMERWMYLEDLAARIEAGEAGE